jgi:hypothetical protein
VLVTLIAGRVQVVQFQGPSSQAAARIVAAISHGYRSGTYILTESDIRMEQYYLPSIPASSWKFLRGSGPGQLSGFRGQICTGRVSLVVLKVPNPHRRRQHSPAIALLRASKFRRVVTVGQGKNATQVWQMADPAQNGTCQ